MIAPDPRRRRRLVPLVRHLESRRLLSFSVTDSPGQHGVDLVGPDAAQGSDGIQDLDLALSGLQTQYAVDHILVTSSGGTSQGGLAWQTAPDTGGYSLAEFFRPAPQSSTGDLFINPQLRCVAPPAGTGTPVSLGGSTGSLVRLRNGNPLTVTVYYQNTSLTDSCTFTVRNLTSPTLSMPRPTVTGIVTTGGMTVTDLGQDSSAHPWETGYVHLVVTAPSGVTFNRGDFIQDASTSTGLVFSLIDQAGLEWDSLHAELSHNHLDAYLEGSGPTGTTVDLYFPPLRPETPVSGSAATMTFQATIPGRSSIYVAQFAPHGGGYDLAAMYSTPSTTGTVNTVQDLIDFLGDADPRGTITLSTSFPNRTIVLSQPLKITHSVTIIGQGDTILFDQDADGTVTDWPSSASGAIYVDAAPNSHTRISLSDLTIRFDEAPVWDNPPGSIPAQWDPENSLGIAHAVIDTGDQNTTQNTQYLTLQGVSIYGPPAYDANVSPIFSTLQALALAQNPPAVYVGEPAMKLIETDQGAGGFSDFGTISNCTFQGGTIDLSSGPWTVTGNTVLGAVAATYSAAAFAFHSPHDLVLSGNHVTQSDATGTEFRLVNFAVSGYNDLVQDNTFGGGAGATGNDVSYDRGASPNRFTDGLNDNEVILEENNAVDFEGRLGAVSADGRVAVLPGVREIIKQGATGAGEILSILSGVNADGTANMAQAGRWFRVAQQVPIVSASNQLELLLADPLPQPPRGGYFVVELTPGFVNDSFVNNTINLTDRTSLALKIDGDAYGTRIIGNSVSYGAVYNGVFPSVAMLIGAGTNSAATDQSSSAPNVPYFLPVNWTTLPNLGSVIQGNSFRNSLGLVVGVEHSMSYYSATNELAVSTGRVYQTASIVQNSFAWDSSLLSGSRSWATAFASDLSQYGLGNDPAESSSPPTVTIGQSLSADPAGAYGSPRYIWSVGGGDAQAGIDPQTGLPNVPFFVDPVENVITVRGNTAVTINPDGSATPRSEPTGQTYEGVVNGITVSSTIAAMQYNGHPYYPFNVNDYPSLYRGNGLDISGLPSGARGPRTVATSISSVPANPQTATSSPQTTGILPAVTTTPQPHHKTRRAHSPRPREVKRPAIGPSSLHSRPKQLAARHRAVQHVVDPAR
jgi:hypothetical protein